ncbi:sugar ABC transporter permease [Streptomyces sp. NPDC049954]|uniref:carbohydrate ABC transporter permease n=1 Tax=Streptomyces sp. NPDC049954 TaxID=3155779 RepID=UPI003444C29A
MTVVGAAREPSSAPPRPRGGMRPPGSAAEARARRRRRADTRTGYAFISPVLLGLLLFTAIPLVLSFAYSFTRYDLPRGPEFTGLDNYGTLFSDPQFWNALRVTLLYAVISVPLQLAGGLFIALLLNQPVPGMRLFRTLIYLPAVLPPLAGVVVFKTLLAPNELGVVNSVLLKLHLVDAPVQFFTSPGTAMPSLLLLALWGAGGSMLIWLAGLRNVPKELIEASRVDGAGPVTRFFRITLPMISPTILFNAVLGLIGAMQVFLQSLIVNVKSNPASGSPLGALDFLNVYIYRHTFGYLQMGLGSAAAWVLFALTLVLTLAFFRWSRRWVFYQGGER